MRLQPALRAVPRVPSAGLGLPPPGPRSRKRKEVRHVQDRREAEHSGSPGRGGAGGAGPPQWEGSSEGAAPCCPQE